MKLYTEEQVKKAIDKGRDYYDGFVYDEEEILNELTPIELPTEENGKPLTYWGGLKQEPMKQKFMYVVVWDGIPILGAPNRELLEQALDEYNNDKFIRYEAYNPKYPNDLEGWYYYKDSQKEGEEIKFSVRCIEFKGE